LKIRLVQPFAVSVPNTPHFSYLPYNPLQHQEGFNGLLSKLIFTAFSDW
jgi:hypothetical protein